MIRRVFLSLALMVVAGSVASAAEKYAFEIYADKAEKTRWRLKDGDGNIVVTSQGYSKKADAARMVDNLKGDISKYKFEYSEDAKKETRFNIMARNGQVVGSSSKGYATKADAEAVVKGIQAGTKSATVTDETKK